MKTTIIKSLIYLTLTCFLLQSCMTTGDTMRSSLRSYSNQSFSQSSHMYLFYGNEAVDFDFIEIGKVSSVGTRTSSYDLTLDYLCYEAWSAGANAVIYISESYIERAETTYYVGGLDDDCDDCCDDDGEDTIYYSADKLQAAAVWVDLTPEFKSRYGEGISMDFVSRVTRNKEAEARKSGAEVLGFLLGGVVSVFVAITGEEED